MNWTQLLGYAASTVPALVTICAAMATLMPPPAGPGAYAALYSFVNAVALNFWHARNAEAAQ